ncbi:hypothetical protein QA584_06920 [Anaerocolumna sp. AGMB13025]|uniref:DUF6809 family protein n=1 Tax=Anaerocolumna sp. AGMB13025 TaxID=3039116 RepID=UPI00241E6742|nr:DUF6809 family protein [Anaerocolumna sp. AGMB13025]WFR58805.1 hypothetical protein QA584_06920 [Anaerocolumna sp. AGMB13025]
MKSILQAIYNGTINPSEFILSEDPEYRSANQKIGEIKTYLKDRLSEEDCMKFTELDDLFNQVISMDSESSFCYGFKLGTLLMIEVLTEKENIIKKID